MRHEHVAEQAARHPERREEEPRHVVTPELPAEARERGAGRSPGRPAAGVHVAPDIARRVLTPEPARVHVAPDIARRVLTPEPAAGDHERRDLDEVVHGVLIVGLALSTALMLLGVGLELARGTPLPEAVAGLGQVLPRVAALRPSGFLTLGLLVLIATPILRVVGSVAAFVYERDWRFAGVTALVLVVMIVSIVLGKG